MPHVLQAKRSCFVFMEKNQARRGEKKMPPVEAVG